MEKNNSKGIVVVLALALAFSALVVVGSAPAVSAGCKVNVGTCYSNGDCTVNAGTCGSKEEESEGSTYKCWSGCRI